MSMLERSLELLASSGSFFMSWRNPYNVSYHCSRLTLDGLKFTVTKSMHCQNL